MTRTMGCVAGAIVLLAAIPGCGDSNGNTGGSGAGGATDATTASGTTVTGMPTSPPTIASFVASPAAITAGETSTLSWTVSDGQLALNGMQVTGTSLVVSPTLTTTYTLTASNGAGQASAETTITVAPAVSSVPSNPIAFTKDVPFTVDSGTTNYVFVPSQYDSTHMTPITLLVWLHGCGGMSSGDIYMVSPGGSQSWISLAVGGQEGNCWNVDTDPAKVMAAIADIKTHFNIKPKGVIMGGYSSGGDLSYRTAFYNANTFAGLIIENSSPYRDTGSSEAASLAAATWKVNVLHLAHLQDTTYPIAGVRQETDTMTGAGYPMTRIEVDGGHYDNAGATENGHAVPGTSADLVTYLLPALDAGWTSP